MAVASDRQRIQHDLMAFDFGALFVEELGWDILREAPLVLSVDGQSFTLRPLAEKRGFKVYLCSPDEQGRIPSSAMMRQIERELTIHTYEHLIIYADAARTQQAWQWVKRESGKPSATRLYRLHKGQSGELLAQKLLSLAFSIEEEDQLGTTVVATRVRQALDAERVTKKFYDRFQKEHAIFLTFIEGIVAQADREWYASLMLNRLMFVYFIQKQGLLNTTRSDALDGDPHYLAHKLREMQARYGNDRFYSFYRYFLLKLFHEGLGQRHHSLELEVLLGNVPYLNGGLFDIHLLERDYPDIQIADEAFERIFAFFDDFDWYLDDRPLYNDREINPDVLGYIFEKYINQKQMGAYYTKEDITGYISKYTIIPRLLEETARQCAVAFTPDGLVWSLLHRDPDRYIYDAMKKGCDLPLPPEIAAGLHVVSQRNEWNKPAPDDYALPTEIWREVVARRNRYEEVRTKLANGEITAVNDLITYNLDILQFAQDVIAYSEGVDLLSAFYASLESITILDPTCGSGAFLFAALNILEPLYEACLDRMQEMVAERAYLDARDPTRSAMRPGGAIARFRDILAQVATHPNRRYFILKSIIIHNLYGVDIMEEAVEICKLRLFLKLVAQIDRFADIEPLPDIDFNICAGNTLVGFATYAEAERAITSTLDFDNTMEQIKRKAQDVERSFTLFRSMQTKLLLDSGDMAAMKVQVQAQLADLNAILDRYLAAEYGIDRSNIKDEREYAHRYAAWQKSHQPFHWFIEFYGIMKRGGFDVIIGNPPWKEYASVRQTYTVRHYATEGCGNLHGLCTERAFHLRSPQGCLSYIVQLPLVGSSRMHSVRSLLRNQSSSLYVIPFDDRPGKLFEGLEHCRSVIIVSLGVCTIAACAVRTTHYQRWSTQARAYLFPLLSFSRPLLETVYPDIFPKYSSPLAESLLTKLSGKEIAHFEEPADNHPVYVHRIIGYFVKAVDFVPYFWNEAEGQKKSEDYKPFYFVPALQDAILAVLNSSLFYWFWLTHGDCFHCGYKDVRAFRLGMIQEFAELPLLQQLGQELMLDLKKNATRKVVLSKATGRVAYDEFNPGMSLIIINAIDRVLARHYGFTDEELDFIINYDIKYRMGHGNNGDDEGE